MITRIESEELSVLFNRVLCHRISRDLIMKRDVFDREEYDKCDARETETWRELYSEFGITEANDRHLPG